MNITQLNNRMVTLVQKMTDINNHHAAINKELFDPNINEIRKASIMDCEKNNSNIAIATAAGQLEKFSHLIDRLEEQVQRQENNTRTLKELVLEEGAVLETEVDNDIPFRKGNIVHG